MNKSSRNIVLEDLIKSRYIKTGKTYKIYFDQPYHLYLDEEQSNAYSEMLANENYSTLLNDPTLELIEKYKGQILQNFNGPLSFYDLGPGVPTKTIPLLKHLQNMNIEFQYYPVDVSTSFLNITEAKMKQHGIPSVKLNCLFEELGNHVTNDSKREKIFYIGLTFNNYRPDKILKLLKELSGKSGTCIIITEYFRRKDIETILLPYKDKYAEKFNYLSLKLAGIDKDDLIYTTDFKNQRIEMGFVVKRNLTIDKRFKIEKGTKIITAISYRYTKPHLIENITRYFSHFEFFEHNSNNISLVALKMMR